MSSRARTTTSRGTGCLTWTLSGRPRAALRSLSIVKIRRVSQNLSREAVLLPPRWFRKRRCGGGGGSGIEGRRKECFPRVLSQGGYGALATEAVSQGAESLHRGTGSRGRRANDAPASQSLPPLHALSSLLSVSPTSPHRFRDVRMAFYEVAGQGADRPESPSNVRLLYNCVCPNFRPGQQGYVHSF